MSGQGERKMYYLIEAMGKLVNSLLFARFIINRTSSFKSNYQLKTIKDMYAKEEE